MTILYALGGAALLVLFVYLFVALLKPELFSLPRLGCINIHKRKVPDYRGGGPVGLWELLDGEREIGVTVHEVTAELDAGAIVNRAVVPIGDLDTLESLALKAHVVGDDLIVRSLAEIAHGYERYVASGEINSTVEDQAGVVDRVRAWAAARDAGIDELDGLTVGAPPAADEMWWFNVRASNTEPLLRLNVEAGDRETMTRIRDEVLGLIRGAPAPAGDVKERPE